MTFDRMLYVDRLKEAGVDEVVARAHAEALREAMLETVATKADIRDLAAAIDARFEGVDRRFEGVDRKFEAVDRKFDALERKLEHKIELTARDLIIKGAGGLIIIASLMIGLKLFG